MALKVKNTATFVPFQGVVGGLGSFLLGENDRYLSLGLGNHPGRWVLIDLLSLYGKSLPNKEGVCHVGCVDVARLINMQLLAYHGDAHASLTADGALHIFAPGGVRVYKANRRSAHDALGLPLTPVEEVRRLLSARTGMELGNVAELSQEAFDAKVARVTASDRPVYDYNKIEPSFRYTPPTPKPVPAPPPSSPVPPLPVISVPSRECQVCGVTTALDDCPACATKLGTPSAVELARLAGAQAKARVKAAIETHWPWLPILASFAGSIFGR